MLMRVVNTGSIKGICVLDTTMEVMSYRRRMEMD